MFIHIAVEMVELTSEVLTQAATKVQIESAKKIVEIMEHAVKLEVPNKVDYEYGDNWGEIHD